MAVSGTERPSLVQLYYLVGTCMRYVVARLDSGTSVVGRKHAVCTLTSGALHTAVVSGGKLVAKDPQVMLVHSPSLDIVRLLRVRPSCSTA